MRKYRLVAKKGEGTFSEVLKAQNVKDGKYYAIKCMKNRFDSIEQVNNLREIQALRRLSPNQHVITLEEVLYDQPTGRLALVFELMDANLYELIRGRRHYLNGQLIRSYMYQLLKALDHMHRKGIFHRDIKPENILIESTNELGKGLKLADFGSCRGIYSKQPYTEYISTRWYRAPECLLTDGYYGPEMDQWGAGCVFFEITSLYPLFPGTNELDQIGRVHKVLGNPSGEVLCKFKRNGAAHVDFNFATQKGIGVAQLIPHASPECVDLITKLLRYDWSERCTARESLRHPYFRELREVELRKAQTEKNSKLVRGNIEDTSDETATVINSSRAPQLAYRTSVEGSQISKALPNIGQGATVAASGGIGGGGSGAIEEVAPTNGSTRANSNGNNVGSNVGGVGAGGKKHPKIAKTGSLARGLGGGKYSLAAAGGGRYATGPNGANGGGAGGPAGAMNGTGPNGAAGGNHSGAGEGGNGGVGGVGGSSVGVHSTSETTEESALPPIMGIQGSGTKLAGVGAGNGATAAGGGGGGAGGAAGGGETSGAAGSGKYEGQSVGQGGSKTSSKKKKKTRSYYDGSMRAKYNALVTGAGGGGGSGGESRVGNGNGFAGGAGAKGLGMLSRSNFSLLQASGGVGAGMGGGMGYRGGDTGEINGGGTGTGIGVNVPGGMLAQAPERARVGRNTTRYRQIR